MKKNKTSIAITMFLMFSMAFSFVALPTADAATSGERKTYPFIVLIDNPVGVGQECLIWFGITDMVVQPATGWKGLTITVTKPDNTTQTLGPYDTDTTGGTGTVYVPTMTGIYYFQLHFPEQVMEYEVLPRTLPAGTILKAADSEKVPLTVQEERTPQHPGFPLPTEYWTRPINAQFREWYPLAGSYLYNAIPFDARDFAPHSLFQPYNEAPETAHILWRRNPGIMGGVAGGERGEHAFDDGTAYEGKWYAFTVGGILYRRVPWPLRSHYQGISAVDLRTGEELWFKEGISPRFGQLMYWDTYNMHGVFAYLWEIVGSTWRAYDAYTGQWWYTLENVPSGTIMFGPKGEILIYTVNLANGWMTLWNSTNVPTLYGDQNYWTMNWGCWRPYGKTVSAVAPHNIRLVGEPYNPSTNPLGLSGYMWNVTIPTGLSGRVRTADYGYILGSSIERWATAADPIELWAISIKEGEEGRLLWRETYRVPGNLTEDIRVISAEERIFVVGVKETRQYYGYSLDTGKKLWGPTVSTPWSDWVSFGQTNWAEVIAYGKLYAGSYGGVLHAFDIKTGELKWTYTAVDEYGESLMGPNWAFGIAFVADGKIYLTHFEHSSFDPLPRGSPTICVDAETGEEIWRIDIRTGNQMGVWTGALPIIGDGVMVIHNSYDQYDYAIGKGPSATSVLIQNDVITHGSTVLVKGMVNDISPGTKETGLAMRFPHGIPAVADESMTDWMHYVYMQYPRPTDVVGVEVVISVLDPNNNCYEVGRTRANADGIFGLSFEPEVPGMYEVIATFEGSVAYYGSHATTYLDVKEANAAMPDPTTPPASVADVYLVPGIVGIIVAIAIVGALVLLSLRKR